LLGGRAVDDGEIQWSGLCADRNGVADGLGHLLTVLAGEQGGKVDGLSGFGLAF
jgi:hypothetical protein